MFLEASTNSIRRRVAVVGSLLIVAPMLILGLAVWAVMQRAQQPLPIARPRHAAANLTELTRNLVDICRRYHHESLDKLKKGQGILEAAGRIRLDANRKTVWQARNGVTGQIKVAELPLMLAGRTEFLPVPNFDEVAPVVDEIAHVAGTPATIFERMNESGDMLRVCSSMKAESGTRAIGSYIPADVYDGDAAQALREVLAGRPYFGKEPQAGIPYLTSYQPLKNNSGNVVGMLSTALSEEQISIQVRPLQPTGANVDKPELFIFEASGETLEGRDVWSEKDPSVRLSIQELRSRAVKLPAGEFADYQFQQPTRINGLPRLMTAKFAYIPELDWVVGYVQPDGEILAAGGPPLLGVATWAIWLLFGVGVAATGLAVRVWLKFSDELAHKIDALLIHLKSDAKRLSEAAAQFSREAERAAARSMIGAIPVHPAVEETLSKAGRMIEEIRSALQHIDASGQSVIGMMGAIDQITFATNLLMVNAAIQASNYSGNEPISGVADELRALAEHCRKAARAAKVEIEESRAELEKGNREVLELVKDLRVEHPPTAVQPSDEIAVFLRHQANNLLQLAQGIDQTVETITADFGVKSNK